MKNTLILINLLFLFTISACTSTTPKKKEMLTESSTTREIKIETYECYDGDLNLEQKPTTLKDKMNKDSNLAGTLLICNGSLVVVDTVLDYGPDQVNILDITTGQWKTHSIKDCFLASPQ